MPIVAVKRDSAGQSFNCPSLVSQLCTFGTYSIGWEPEMFGRGGERGRGRGGGGGLNAPYLHYCLVSTGPPSL